MHARKKQGPLHEQNGWQTRAFCGIALKVDEMRGEGIGVTERIRHSKEG